MSLPATIDAYARVAFALYRSGDGKAIAVIEADLPGAETLRKELLCDLTVKDEAYTWANDFHGESKAWRSLLDSVAFDWCERQLAMF